MRLDQVKCVASVPPRYRVASAEWIGSLKSRTGRGLPLSLAAVQKSSGHILREANSSPPAIGSVIICLQVADGQLNLAERGYDGRVIRLEG